MKKRLRIVIIAVLVIVARAIYGSIAKASLVDANFVFVIIGLLLGVSLGASVFYKKPKSTKGKESKKRKK